MWFWDFNSEGAENEVTGNLELKVTKQIVLMVRKGRSIKCVRVF